MTRISPGFPSIVLCALAGLAGGLGAYTFHFGEGTSYFRDDPEACVNCHVMRDQFESWSHSSHRTWATCNDCHMPHTFFNQWWTKALNGYNHSVKFTTGNFPEPIRIGERNRKIALENCIRCHSTPVSQMHIDPRDPMSANCIACHGNVGHQGFR